MKNLKTNNLLIISSLLILICYSIIVVVESFSEEKVSMMNLSLVFGNVIIATIFILDKAAAKEFKVSKYITYLLRFLIVYSTIFCGVLLNELVSIGFLTGKELFWQLMTIFLAISSIVLIQVTQQKKFSKKSDFFK